MALTIRVFMLAMLGLATAACGDEPAPPPPAKVAEPEPEPPPRAPSLYDAEGRLKESDRELRGIRLPVGLTRLEHTPADLHVFHSEGVPLDKLIAYFGPRLFTGQIERTGAGIVYKRAVPMDDRDAEIPMDVAIQPVGPRRVKVSLREYAPVPLHPASVESLQKTLLREQKQIE